MTVKFTKFDPVDYLDSPERIDDYLAAAKEENDPIFYAKANRTAKRAKERLHSTDRLSLKVSFERHSVRSIHKGLVTLYPRECYGVV